MTEYIAKPSGQPYELFVFARRHSIALDCARAIITRHGADRVACDRAASTCATLAHQAGGAFPPPA